LSMLVIWHGPTSRPVGSTKPVNAGDQPRKWTFGPTGVTRSNGLSSRSCGRICQGWSHRLISNGSS